MISALITNKNKPSVNNVIGKVRIISSGLTIAFNIASTIATRIAVQKVSIEIPDRIYDNPNATIDVIMIRMINLMI